MRDLGPEAMRRFRRIETAFRGACDRWMFSEIRTPVVEPLHLFTSAGTLSPNLLDRVYSFLDWDGWSGERVVLRPDSTIATARYVAEHPGEHRLYYVQNVFRFAPNGDDRELWQCGAELSGDTEPRGDLELILLALEALEALDLRASVRVSHTGVIRAILGAANLEQPAQAALYDRILDGDASALAELESAAPAREASLNVLFDGRGGSAFVRNMRALYRDSLAGAAPAFDVLETLTGALEALHVPVEASAALARNFEYYTGTVFQFVVDGHVVGNGGRYDSLLGASGASEMPASGFALDIDAIADLLAPAGDGSDPRLSVRTTDDSVETLVAAVNAVRAAHRRGAPARLLTAGERGEALEVGGTPPAFSWAGHRIEGNDDAVAVALSLPR